MSYLAVKHLHMSLVALSGSLFLLRGFWMACGSPLLRHRWTRIVPHVIDTGLLASALTLAVWSGQYPFQQGWLTAKVLGLLAYIVLGSIALKRGATMRIRLATLGAAALAFGYIVAVALTKRALLFW